MTTDDEFASVMEQINGPAFPRIYAVAERYVKRKLPELYTPSPNDDSGRVQMLSTQTRVASLFIRACKDFLIRGSTDRAGQYRADAETLEAALQVILRDDRRYFDSLMVDGITVDAPVGEPGPVRIISRSGDRAIKAFKDMAKQFREIADDYDKDSKIITFFYDVGRLFGRDKLPTAGEANAVYVILIDALRDVAPQRLVGIRKTEYDSNDDGKQIRDLMVEGAPTPPAAPIAQGETN